MRLEQIHLTNPKDGSGDDSGDGRENRELFRAFFDHATDAMLLTTLDGSILEVNSSALQMFGWTRAELLDGGLNTLIDPADPRSDLLLSAHGRNSKAHGELTFKRKNGQKFTCEIDSTILGGKDGGGKMSIIIRDITEKKRAETELKLSEEKYRGLMESLDNVVAVVDHSGTFHYMNEIAARQLGGTAVELIGRSMYDLFPKPVAARHMESIRKAIQEDKKFVVENQSSVRGELRWYRTAIQPIHDEYGRVLFALINASDIHDLKTAQRELLEINLTLEERIAQRTLEVQDLYQNAPTGYHSLDQNGVFTMINQTELNWLGYTSQEIVGVKKFSELTTAAGRQKFEENFPGFQINGQVKDLEFEMIRKDGSLLPILLSSTATYDENGNFVQSRSILFDITQRKKDEMLLREHRDKLSAANQELEKAARMKDEFLASMSHELRTPLTGILGLSEVLQHKTYGELNDRQSQAINTITESGRHLLELINDILDLSKIESGKLKLEITQCSMMDICQASLNLTRGMAAQKNQIIQYTPPPKSIMLQADSRRLKQVIVNLLSNAIKFTPENGKLGLTVEADALKMQIRIIVWDQGIGIKSTDRDKLFTPFTQIDSSLTRENSGTGLGLSLVQRLVKMHNGNVEMDSIFGQGSRFTVVLPWDG